MMTVTTITNADLLNLEAALGELLKLRPRTSAFLFKLRAILQGIKPHLETVRQAREDIGRSFLELGPDGEPLPVMKDGKPLLNEHGAPLYEPTDAVGYAREIDQLLGMRVELPLADTARITAAEWDAAFAAYADPKEHPNGAIFLALGEFVKE